MDECCCNQVAPGFGIARAESVLVGSSRLPVPDLIAICLSNLALLDLNAIVLGGRQLVLQESLSAQPQISAVIPVSNNVHVFLCQVAFGGPDFVAGWLSVFFNGTDFADFPFCRVEVHAARSRFNAGVAGWCKRTRGPITTDPSVGSPCFSGDGGCALIECKHYAAAAGIIEPELNRSIVIGPCSAPGLPCNPVPIAFP